MSKCPNCGAELEIDQELAHFAVCAYCNSALIVDTDALKLSGNMAVLRPPRGPLRLGSTGSIGAKGFAVMGRVRYAYPAGFWDEWFIRWESGESGWISQDEDRLVLEQLVETEGIDLEGEATSPGSTVNIAGRDFTIREKGRAVLEAAEGQLPFEIISGEDHPYIDLIADSGEVGTLEITDKGARLFLGKSVGADELVLDQPWNPQEEDSLDPEQAAGGRRRVVKKSGRERALNCESCGGSLRAPEGTDVMTCEHCGSQVDLLLDRIECPSCPAIVPVFNLGEVAQITCPACHARIEHRDGSAQLLEPAPDDAHFPKRTINVGDQCEFSGHTYRVAGYVQLVEHDDGKPYYTEEYLLFNRETGYRWLSEYHGHWSLYNELTQFPKKRPRDLKRKKSLKFRDRTWKVIETGRARISAVDGELPWIAAKGDSSAYADAISPPFILSAEWTDDEITWSEGRYVEPQEIAAAFGIAKKRLPRRIGVGANQPYRTTPFRQQSVKVMLAFAILAAVLVFWSAISGFKHERQIRIAREDYRNEFITDSFDISTAPSLCVFSFDAPVNNEWVYLDVALINSNDEAVMDFSAEMSYYHGVEGGESWSEGSQTDDIPVRIEDAGTYRLLVKGEAGTGETPDAAYGQGRYTVTVTITEKVTLTRYFILMMIFCLLWMGAVVLPRLIFESRRWSEEE